MSLAAALATARHHRPDIDGLRALAVLMVVVHHAFPGTLPGGYLGVDVFFVISGFLISQILLRGIEDEAAGRGAFRLADFYRRRIQRILPALVLVVAVTLALGGWLLWPQEYRQLGAHAAANAVFALNFVLAGEAGYFDHAAQHKPLLHLWSLAVEEQFYLVWPWLLHAAMRRGGRRALGGLLALAALSLGAMVVSARQDAAATFFLPQARAWELTVGAVGALVLHRHGAAWTRLRSRLFPRETCALAGLLLVAASAALLGAHRHTSPALLLPVLGTLLVLLADPEGAASRRLLSGRAMTALGRISYPLYLWHWPLLSLATVAASGLPSPGVRVALVLASVGLAWLTLVLLEQQVRPARSAAVPWILVGLLGACGLWGALIVRLDGLPARTAALNPLIAQFDWDVPRWTWSADAPACRQRDPSAHGIQAYCHQNLPDPPGIALLGDSHALQLYPGLSARLAASGQSLRLLGASACAPFHGLDIRWTVDTKRCSAVMDGVLDEVIATPSIHTVVLAHRGPFYVEGLPTAFELAREPQPRVRLVLDGTLQPTDNLDAYRHAMARTLAALQRAGKRVILVIDTPEIAMEPRACVRRPPGPQGCGVPVDAYRDRARRYLQATAEVLRQFPAVEVWDLPRWFCDGPVCLARRGDDILYRDADHLTVRGSQRVAEQFTPQPGGPWAEALPALLMGRSGAKVTSY